METLANSSIIYYNLLSKTVRENRKYGELAERSKAAVLKTVEANSFLGFESLTLRQKCPKSKRVRFRAFFIQTARFGISSRHSRVYHSPQACISSRLSRAYPSMRFDDMQFFRIDDMHDLKNRDDIQ